MAGSGFCSSALMYILYVAYWWTSDWIFEENNVFLSKIMLRRHCFLPGGRDTEKLRMMAYLLLLIDNFVGQD